MNDSARLLLSVTLGALAASALALAASAQDRTFRSESAFVELSVVALGRDGQRIADLTAEDIRISEDGQPQVLATFLRKSGSSGSRRSDKPVATVAVHAATSSDRKAYLLVIDSFHLSFGQRGRVERAVRDFLGRYLGESDVASLVVLGMQPRASVFSSSLSIVLSSLESASLSGPLTGGDGGLDLGSEETNEAVAGAMALAGAMSAERSLAQLAVAARALGELRGARKSVLFFSEGVGTDLFPSANPQARDAAQRVLEAQETFIRAASAADVAVYPIDVRGLAAIDPFSSGEPVGLREWSSLRVLADGTGGIAFVGRRNLEPVFAQIVADTSEYYQLGYYSTTKSDGRFHRLEVTCRRDGVVVRGRTLTPSPKPDVLGPAVAPSIRALLNRALPLDTGGIELRASATPSRLAADSAEVTVVVEIASWGRESPTEGASTSNTSGPQVGIAVYDSFGRRLLERVVALPSKGHVLTTSIRVPRNLWQLRVAALTEGGRAQGSVFLDLDVRPARTGRDSSAFPLTGKPPLH